MTTLRDELLRFVDLLRARGVRISVAETIDAMNAVAAAGIGPVAMREALAASLIKDEADRPVFDETFAAFFRAPGAEPGPPGEKTTAQRAMGRGRGAGTPIEPRPPQEPPSEAKRPSAAEKKEAKRPEDAEAKRPQETEAKPDERGAERAREAGGREHRERMRSPREEAGIEARHHAGIRAVERKPFAHYSDLDYDLAREALKPLGRRFKVRLGRRMRIARRGRVDFRRTIRAATQRGGALLDLRFRSRRPRHIDLLILADVSGSMGYSSRLMLELAAGARQFFRRVRSFVYVDRLAEADFEQGHLVMTPALDLYALSDFGRVLDELWKRRAELLSRATVLVIMGDGRNNRRPPRADLLREIARTCRAVLWLNPEAPERWGTGDSAIRLYEREVRSILPARNLSELERGLERVP
jgi:uncharacterized protein